MVVDHVPQPRITLLYRYPVKGMSAEPLPKLVLTPGDGVPGDRIMAFARPDTVFDEEHPEPLPKTRFFMLKSDEVLARIRTTYDPLSGHLRLIADAEEIKADIGNAHEVRRVEEFLARQLNDERIEGGPRLVRAWGRHRFTDAGPSGPDFMQSVSVINLASVRHLERTTGSPVHPLRFRANIYVDGLPPWSELDWAGKTVTLGQVSARVLATTPRCAATSVNPDTGIRDMNLLKALSENYGHIHCGIYISVLSPGTVHLGEAFGPPTASEEG